ncbi:MAG: ParA family protein [Chloroflexota bacterium]
MTKIIAIANNKGGVAKTTTAGNLAYGLSRKLLAEQGGVGKVLIIDLDTQGNQADFFGVRDRVYHSQRNPEGACLSNLINEPSCEVRDFVISVDRQHEGLERPNLFLIPATRELGYAVENVAALDSISDYQASISRGRRQLQVSKQLDTLLSDRLQRLSHNFDYIIVDCPPNLDLLKTAVYEFADEVIVPVKTDRLSAIGAQQHTDDIVQMIKGHNLKIKISYILPTMMRKRQTLAEQTVEALQRRYGPSRVATPIPESVHVKEGPAAGGLTLFEYAPRSEPAIAYADLVERVYHG